MQGNRVAFVTGGAGGIGSEIAAARRRATGWWRTSGSRSGDLAREIGGLALDLVTDPMSINRARRGGN